MDKTNYVLCGMAYGDEGKGTFVDYIAHQNNIGHIVRYNGGSHASHTVITPEGTVHKFSQLGSGMFKGGAKTYLSENMVINIDSLVVEAEVFAREVNSTIDEILGRIFIHENCYVVTPYHRLLKRLKEAARGKNRHGGVGTGVSETMYLVRTENLGIKALDLSRPDVLKNKLRKIYKHVLNFVNENRADIEKNTDNQIYDSLNREMKVLTGEDSVEYLYNGYCRLIKKYKFNICSSFKKKFESIECAVFEGSQGLLIDYEFGIRPNTTILDTTTRFALEMLRAFEKDEVIKIGAFKAFASRHGMGVFPTEDVGLNKKISDENQSHTFWNGANRFGWFDGVLARYAQRINNVDQVYLSSIDKLDNFTKIKICNEYRYTGALTDEFDSIFEYEDVDGEIVIKNILKNSDHLKEYLLKCKPIYTEIKGWKRDTSNIRESSGLPINCKNYIKKLEKSIGVNISVVSVGPTREHKIKVG